MNDQETQKKRWPRAAAMAVAEELVWRLQAVCERICVAGSLRRGKAMVGDVEILYIPRFEQRQVDLFNIERVDQAGEVLQNLLRAHVLCQRLSARGTPAWGHKNKLAVHVASGIPVDLFAASEANWWNYLVCRTGSAESNMRIARAAIAKGWQWNPYGPGFSRGGPLAGAREIVARASEREVFEFVGLPYLPPEKR